jgi:uncharacterized protein YoxC
MEILRSLHEFMLMTKGREYLIAVAFLILFVFFFRFLNSKPKRTR